MRHAGRVAVTVLAAVALTPACDKVPLTAPTASTITLSTNTTVLPIAGTAAITATVIESAGTPVQNGTLVTFSTTLGSLVPRDAQTHNGSVTVTFQAGSQSGTAEISAASGAAKLNGTVSIKVGGAAAAKIVLNATPAAVPAAGGTVTLAVFVLDSNGNTLPGVPVALTANAGSLSSPTVVTDASGTARTYLTTNRETTVTATAGSTEATTTIRVSLAPVVTLTTSTASPTVNQSTVFQVSVQPGTNSAAIASVLVDFGDGSTAGLGNLTGQTSVSHVYRAAGTYTATVTAVDTGGQQSSVSTIVTVASAPPLSVTLSASPTTAAVGAVVSFTATVTVSGGGTMPGIKQYIWDFGDDVVVTTSGPQTTHIYNRSGPKTVTVTVVTVDGVTAVTRVEINIT